MPIRPELKQFYVGPEWLERRHRILNRAKNCCEQCGKPNTTVIWTFTWKDPAGLHMAWRPAQRVVSEWRNEHGQVLADKPSQATKMRGIVVILTVAHLNHDPEDNRDENLNALCQWCHLHYDQAHHKQSRIIRKDAARPLLGVGSINVREVNS
jgi:sugar phosphate isomerase/epimerase